MLHVVKDYNSKSEDNANKSNTENFEEKDKKDSRLIPLLSELEKGR